MPIVGGWTALVRQGLPLTPPDLRFQLDRHLNAHLATLEPDSIAWNEWRTVMLRLARTTGAPFITTDQIMRLLLDPDPRQRGLACVLVQLQAVGYELSDETKDFLRPHLLVTASSDIAGVRGEAARALAVLVRPEDFARLYVLFLADPLNRFPLAAALRARDAISAEKTSLADRDRLYLDELGIFTTPMPATTP